MNICSYSIITTCISFYKKIMSFHSRSVNFQEVYSMNIFENI